MGTTLRVVGKSSDSEIVESTGVSKEELERAEEELRHEARNLVHEIDRKYWDLGRVLYDVYDGVPGGYRALMKGKGSATERVALFEKWGYKSFGDWVEQEVGIRKRTAENLRFAYYYFAVQQEMPEDIIDRLIAVGRSKVYLLAGLADKSNITLWIDKAENLTFEDLKKAKMAAQAVIAGNSEDTEEVDQSGGMSSGAEGDAGSKPLPKPEEMHMFQAGLFPGQKQTCDAAFQRAQNITKSEKKGHNLELICQDFLSNNSFEDPKKDLDSYISKMERRLGVLIIAINPSTGKPVHGRDLLWRLTEEAAGKGGSEE